MLRELPNGQILVFMVDLSYLSEKEFDDLSEKIARMSFDVQYVPGKQMLKVYWNCEESIADVFSLPAGRVSPWLGSM